MAEQLKVVDRYGLLADGMDTAGGWSDTCSKKGFRDEQSIDAVVAGNGEQPHDDRV